MMASFARKPLKPVLVTKMANTNGLTFREFKGFDEILTKANTAQLDYLLGALVDEIRTRTGGV